MPEALPSSSPSGPKPRRLEPGRGLEWWREAWALFMKSPGMWLLLALVIVVIDLMLGVLPFIGTIASVLVMPGFIASWMAAARKLEAGGKLGIGDLAVAFQQKLQPMLILGVIFVVASLAALALTGAGAGMGLSAGSTDKTLGTGLALAIGVGGLSIVLALVLLFLIATLLWFAPTLVMFDDMEPVAALKASWAASLNNVVPFLVYGLIYVVAALVASLLFGLGWIVLLPVSFLTAYTSYKDVFGA